MATLSSDGKYVTVVKGDTLWGIAAAKPPAGLGSGIKYKQLASINNISNPNLIYVGQKIYLTSEGGSSSGSSSSSANSNKPEITAFGELSTKDDELFATWTWSKSKDHTAKYKVSWTYLTSNGVWFNGNLHEISVDEDAEELSRQDTFTIPSGATQVKFKVKPISETYKNSNDVETNYWTADWSNEKTWTDKTPLETPNTPSIEIDKFKLTATLDDIDITGATHIEFEVVKDNSSKVFATAKGTIETGHASYAFTIDAGGEYKVRCRAYNSNNKTYSDYSKYSSNAGTIPSTPESITKIEALDETSVQVYWEKVTNATGYTVEYTTKKIYFDTSSSNVQSVSVEDNTNCATITGMTSGEEYFFRVKATNKVGDSGWTEIKSIVIGEPPAAPTTWSSTTTAVSGESVILYWVHNAKDDSNQTYADLELYFNGSKEPSDTYTLMSWRVLWKKTSTILENVSGELVKDTTTTTGEKVYVHLTEDGDVVYYYCIVEEDSGGSVYYEVEHSSGIIDDNILSYTPLTEEEMDNGTINSCTLKTTSSIFTEGSKIEWRIRTAGITKDYGDWSTKRTITVNAPATLQLDITDASKNTIETLTSFPFYISALPGPKTQAPIGYHLSIKSNEIYETVDSVGNPKTISAGEEVYSKYFDVNYDLLVELSAGHIDLENNITYTVDCTVSMNSGLTKEASREFTVSWEDVQYTPNAQIGIDEETMTANIRPYCEDRKRVYYQVTPESVSYKKTDIVFDFAFGEEVDGAVTTTGEQVYDGMSTDGNTGYYCQVGTTYYKVIVEPGVCTKTDTVLSSVFGETLSGVKTTTGEQVYKGTTADGNDVYYCIIEEQAPVTGVLMSVYRREFDGSFTELATGLDSTKATTITDPHPALDLARYRIVATAQDTGAVSYYDPPGYPVGGKAVIIQWDEEWSSFEAVEDATMVQPAWVGSMLTLPYNIDVSDSHSPDISLIEYAGRSHPVSYYGTQLGTSATWSLVIPKDDKETLYALRRLARWMGDVYVREPSGSGYWANIKVSFSQKHGDVTIPVTLSITRVEGGI